ncbi:hypothetical protein [Dyella sp.]|jgi:hypothetical protein|uniref:hypothetical protein n=1 Tax=Dyella sp. TaxID=1869338 RepID=UPI002D778CFF|nr:hypothetical protein [Dyella sp.]HET6433672.1 hypothetical protein [Dyella sp.]
MIGRCLAGVLLGFPLSAMTLALAMALSPARGAGWVIAALIAFFPLWTGVMAASYLFRSGARAWLVLGLANAAAFALLQGVRLSWSGP